MGKESPRKVVHGVPKDKFPDELVTAEDCVRDLFRVKELLGKDYIPRHEYRLHGAYSERTWEGFFGKYREFAAAASTVNNKHQNKILSQISNHSAVDHYRKYFNEQILPYHDKYKKKDRPDKIKTMIVASDFHDIHTDKFALGVFIDTCKRKRPDIIVFNGDIFDLFEFGRYTVDIRNVKIKERFEFVHKEIFARVRRACPDTQIDFIMGNHCFRLITHLANATPAIRILLSDVVGLSFAEVFGLDKYQINWISKIDLGVFTNKDLRDEMKKNYRIYYDCFAVTHEPDARIKKSMSGTNGHHHKASLDSDASVQMGATTWTQTPCMHYPDAEYLNRFPDWNVGFLEVTIDTERKQVIQKIHQIHDKWTVVDGVYYERPS